MTLTRRKFLTSLSLLPIYKFIFANKALAGVTQSSLRVAFGSCNNQLANQDFWFTIADTQPQVWLGLGDNIYADLTSGNQRVKFYNQIKTHPGFVRLKQMAKVNATWDDHDYGFNNAGGEFPGKEASKQALLDFLDEPNDSIRRKQKGIYTSFIQGDVEFLLLDLRWFKPWRWLSQNLIGDEQWAWLENRLRNSTAKLVVICSSVQCLPEVKEKECWNRFPKSRTRLLQLIEQANRPIMIFSGDRHFYEVSQMDLENGRQLVEITSSGLTHVSDVHNENEHRVGDVVYQKNFCVLDLDFVEEKIVVSATAYQPDSGELLRRDNWTF